MSDDIFWSRFGAIPGNGRVSPRVSGGSCLAYPPAKRRSTFTPIKSRSRPTRKGAKQDVGSGGESSQASDRRVCCQKTCGESQVLQKRDGYERELIKREWSRPTL